MHTSVLEQMVATSVAGVCVLTCAERDCPYREGPHWLHERVYDEREAKLEDRVEKRRVRIGGFAASEIAGARESILSFDRHGGVRSPEELPPDGAADAAAGTRRPPDR